MNTNITKSLTEKALLELARRTKPVKLTPEQTRIQEVFLNFPGLTGNDNLAELVFAITGFRPRTSNTRLNLFDVFYVGGSINKPALCVQIVGSIRGCMSPCESSVAWDASCRLATPEETARFIGESVTFWQDGAFMAWFAANVGNAQLHTFLNAINS